MLRRPIETAAFIRSYPVQAGNYFSLARSFGHNSPSEKKCMRIGREKAVSTFTMRGWVGLQRKMASQRRSPASCWPRFLTKTWYVTASQAL